jgi:hypothetical protein
MFRVYVSVVAVLMSLNSTQGLAILEIEGPTHFRHQVEDYLEKGRKISHHTRRLVDAVNDSEGLIRIRPLTDDPATWHRSGVPTRSHTRIVRKKKSQPKNQAATRAIIYLNSLRIEPAHKSYSRGTLIHELVHALDLVKDRYHANYVIREKRAVFFQNIWREAHGKRMRRHYHNKFDTLEYPEASAANNVEHFVDYYFEHADIPGNLSQAVTR